MIQIDHVTFSYGEETEHTGGVRDIELQIKRGEFAVLCGESGCGKSMTAMSVMQLVRKNHDHTPDQRPDPPLLRREDERRRVGQRG